jgi:hypothetical protein
LVQVGEGPDPETFLVENLRTKTGKLIKPVVVANGGDVKCRRKKEATSFRRNTTELIPKFFVCFALHRCSVSFSFSFSLVFY